MSYSQPPCGICIDVCNCNEAQSEYLTISDKNRGTLHQSGSSGQLAQDDIHANVETQQDVPADCPDDDSDTKGLLGDRKLVPRADAGMVVLWREVSSTINGNPMRVLLQLQAVFTFMMFRPSMNVATTMAAEGAAAGIESGNHVLKSNELLGGGSTVPTDTTLKSDVIEVVRADDVPIVQSFGNILEFLTSGTVSEHKDESLRSKNNKLDQLKQMAVASSKAQSNKVQKKRKKKLDMKSTATTTTGSTDTSGNSDEHTMSPNKALQNKMVDTSSSVGAVADDNTNKKHSSIEAHSSASTLSSVDSSVSTPITPPSEVTDSSASTLPTQSSHRSIPSILTQIQNNVRIARPWRPIVRPPSTRVIRRLGLSPRQLLPSAPEQRNLFLATLSRFHRKPQKPPTPRNSAPPAPAPTPSAQEVTAIDDTSTQTQELSTSSSSPQ